MNKFSFRRIGSWINQRLPLEGVRRWLLHEEIPGGASFFYSLGSASIFLLVILFLTGIWELFVYVPTIDHAYESLSYFRLNVPFGWLAHGLHYWSAIAFSVIIVLHMIRTFIWGAYKRPRELIWFCGVALFFLMMAFMFTGPILAWDKKGYWAGRVGMEMVGAIPIFGSFFQSIIWGSSSLTQVALSRMFTWHIALLPILLIFFLTIHLFAFRKQGSIGTLSLDKKKKSSPLWPDQLYKNSIVFLVLFLILISLSVFVPPPFGGMADPLDTGYIPKPAWIFLSVYQLLKYFPGKWESLAIVGIPVILGLTLLLPPFLDRKERRNPNKRITAMVCAFLLTTFIVVLTILGYLSGPSQAGGNYSLALPGSMPKISEEVGKKQKNLTENPILGKSTRIIGNYRNGETIYENNCLLCHGHLGQPVRGRSQIVTFGPSLKPIDKQLFDNNPQRFVEKLDPVIQHGSGIMPAFGDQAVLTQQKIADVEAYLLKVNGIERTKILHPGVSPIRFFLILSALVFAMLITYFIVV